MGHIELIKQIEGFWYQRQRTKRQRKYNRAIRRRERVIQMDTWK